MGGLAAVVRKQASESADTNPIEWLTPRGLPRRQLGYFPVDAAIVSRFCMMPPKRTAWEQCGLEESLVETTDINLTRHGFLAGQRIAQELIREQTQ